MVPGNPPPTSAASQFAAFLPTPKKTAPVDFVSGYGSVKWLIIWQLIIAVALFVISIPGVIVASNAGFHFGYTMTLPAYIIILCAISLKFIRKIHPPLHTGHKCCFRMITLSFLLGNLLIAFWLVIPHFHSKMGRSPAGDLYANLNNLPANVPMIGTAMVMMDIVNALYGMSMFLLGSIAVLMVVMAVNAAAVPRKAVVMGKSAQAVVVPGGAHSPPGTTTVGDRRGGSLNKRDVNVEEGLIDLDASTSVDRY